MYYTKLSSKLSENIFGILIQFPADSVIFTEEILNGKLHFLSSAKFKVGLSPSKIVVFICFTESSLIMIKNAFYFVLKALLVLKTVEFLS